MRTTACVLAAVMTFLPHAPAAAPSSAQLPAPASSPPLIYVAGQTGWSSDAAGGGLVKVKASAKGRIIGVDIDESLLAASEKQMLEDLIVAAFNDAKAKADAASNAEMSKMTSGLPLPPGFKLPF